MRTGLALYGEDGRLVWFRSHNFGSVARLRRAIPAILADNFVTNAIAEGGGVVRDAWARECERAGVELTTVSAEEWRAALLLPREQHTGAQAKRVADTLARRVIEWSNAPRPTSLRHDAAEAILVGLWQSVQLGWLAAVPASVRG